MAVRQAWGIFSSNLRCRDWKRLGIQRRLNLLDRCVGSFLLHRISLWPASETICEKLGRIQRHMVARALGLYKLPVESFKVYFKRCSDEARKCIGSTICDWSLRWIRATLSWDDHMSRDWAWQQKFFNAYPQSRSFVCHPQSGFQMLHVKEFFCTSFSWAVALSRVLPASFFAAVRVVCETERSHSSRTNTRCIKGFCPSALS